ncbi:MAG: TlpA disulfide reductase family protein [Pirellulales bacterium]
MEASKSRLSFLQWLVPLALAGVVVFAALRPREAVPLTALELTPLNDAARPLMLDDLRGQVVLMNFWGTWCPPCRDEFPHLVALAKQYADRKDFRFLSISSPSGPDVGLSELRTDTQAYLALKGYDLPQYADPSGATRRATAAVAEAGVYPATFLIDREGRIVAGWLGYTPAAFEDVKMQTASLLGTSH